MSVESKSDGRTVQLKGVRLSFAESLQVKKAAAKTEDAKLVHQCNLILEKESEHFEDNKRKVREAIEKACELEWKNKDKHKQIAEDSPKNVAYRKGERFKNKDGVVYDGYAGNMAIAGKGPKAGQNRPKLLDRSKRRLKEQVVNPADLKSGRYFEDIQINDIFYNGSYCDAVVSFYGTDKGGGDKLCVSVDAIRSYQRGDRMGGGGIEVDDDDFDDFDDEDGDLSGASGDEEDDIG